MLKELLELEERLQRGDEPTPVGYKRFGRASPIRWILHINPETAELQGEPEPTEIDHKPRPTRQRSGKISATNLKPYLLVDEARYVLGIAEPGKEKEAELVHGAFLDLLRQAGEKTGLTELKVMHQALARKIDRRGLSGKIAPREVVACQVGNPLIRLKNRKFSGSGAITWKRNLAQAFRDNAPYAAKTKPLSRPCPWKWWS